MAATRGRIVCTPTEEKPYKVVFEYEGSVDIEHAVESMREGEELIKKQTPTAPQRDKTFDRSPGAC